MKKYNKFLNEMLFEKIPTNYTQYKTNSIINAYNDFKFDFFTNKNNQYSVYILMTKEDIITFEDNSILNDIIIPTIIFSETKNGLDTTTFNKLTNANEFAEVMGKVIFIILEFINKHPEFNIYSIGEVSKKKLTFYKHYLHHFKNFKMKIGTSTFYVDNNGNYTDAYYLIK